jgi:acyl-[acyl-carrier-protein]-phospholipid O-acyltransferase/long-chain-fatty-acid--[acyl-carrier-protein] ligase
MSSIQILNQSRLPKSGVLVIPGRLDPHTLGPIEKLFAGRKITWLIEEHATLDPQIKAHLEKSGSGAMYSAADTAPAAAGAQLKSFLDQGILIHVPGKTKVRVGAACHIPTADLKALTAFGLPILPIAIDTPRDSHLSIESASSLPQAIISIGNAIPAEKSSVAAYQENLLSAFEEAYSSRPLFKKSLAMVLLQGLKKHASVNKVLDGSDDSELGFDKVLGAAIALSKFIREETDKPRVAIVLPPGKAGLIANLAVIFAGKVPVNLNFTAGHEAVTSSIRQSGVDRFITADPFVRKVSSFPWPPNRDLIFIERTLPNLKKEIVKWVLLSKVLPAAVLGNLLGLNKRKDSDEALLLFTSGSSGEPKGVVLTNRNVLGNVCQFGTRLDLPSEKVSILGCLPLFHSFGCTVTLWYPCIEGINLVTYPSPLETKRLAELIGLHDVDILLATPTFLRGYMKRIEPAQLASLKLVVTGAEKLPQNLADAFEQKFGIRPQEGYGLTETSPATNVNLPDLSADGGLPVLPSSRNGSVGQMLPGLALKLTDAATGSDIPLNQQGIIWFKGVNIFPGYLGQEKKSAEVLIDGWFRTGDVGRVDDDGFLYIEGRLSRFSKIAGEMVPHETVEASIAKVLGLDSEAERKIAIVGVPDEQKGEAILLLSTISGPALEQECIDLRYKLLDQGLSSLWCPKAIIPVKEIPVLASGKLDIKGCEELAGHR